MEQCDYVVIGLLPNEAAAVAKARESPTRDAWNDGFASQDLSGRIVAAQEAASAPKPR
jgi:hypothetical protein